MCTLRQLGLGSWLVLGCCTASVAGIRLADSTDRVRVPLSEAHEALDRAKASVAGIGRGGTDPRQAQALLEIERALSLADARQRDAVARLADLTELAVSLDRERSVLDRNQADLQQREKLFSLGFYASFTTALIAILGLVGKLPFLSLERKLKLLELRERELALREREARLSDVPLASPRP